MIEPDSTQGSSTSWGQSERVQQHTSEQIVNRPRVRISERVVEQTVDIPAPSGGRISERIVEQMGHSRARIPERIVEQTVDILRSSGRFSERIAEQIVDVVPGSPGGGTPCAAAAASAAAQCTDDGFCRAFSRRKSANIGRQSSANLLSHSSPTTGPLMVGAARLRLTTPLLRTSTASPRRRWWPSRRACSRQVKGATDEANADAIRTNLAKHFAVGVVDRILRSILVLYCFTGFYVYVASNPEVDPCPLRFLREGRNRS